MQRSHSRKTYPADKMMPCSEALPMFRVITLSNGSKRIRYNSPEQKKFDKKFHTRKSRRFSRAMEREVIN